MSILIFNDLHLADNPPASRQATYRDEGLDMLAEVMDIAYREVVEAVVTTGDLFHVKSPHRTSHELMQQVIGILGTSYKKKIPVYVVPGNHDMGAGGVMALHKQPLGVLHQAGVVQVLAHHYTPKNWVDLPSGWRIVGREYHDLRDADPRYYALRTPEQSDRPTLLVAHGSIVPQGEEREYPTVSVKDIDWTGIDVIASGHIHENLGTSGVVKGKLFTNVGALGRTARTLANMTRTLQVVMLSRTTDVTTIEHIPLKTALPPEEAFIPHAPVVESEDQPIAEFVRALADNTTFEQVELEDFIRQVCRERGVGPEIEARLRAVLEE